MTTENDIGTLVLTNGRERRVLVDGISYKDSQTWCANILDPRKPGWDIAWVDANGHIALWPMWMPFSRDDAEWPLEFGAQPDAESETSQIPWVLVCEQCNHRKSKWWYRGKHLCRKCYAGKAYLP